MEDMDILKALYNGSHLESKELERAEKLIYLLRVEFKSRYNEPQKENN